MSFFISFSKKEGPWVIGTEIKFTGTAFCGCLLLPCSKKHKKKACSRETNKQNAKNTTVTIFSSNTYRVFILAFIESQKAGLLRLPFWASFLYALIISFEAVLARKIITKAKKQLLWTKNAEFLSTTTLMRTIEQKGLDKDWFTMPSYRGYVSKYIQVIPKTALKTQWNQRKPWTNGSALGKTSLLPCLNYEWMTLRFAGEDGKQIVTWKSGPKFSS